LKKIKPAAARLSSTFARLLSGDTKLQSKV
jgi:hypothetical protein